jgi:hypothetical protein
MQVRATIWGKVMNIQAPAHPLECVGSVQAD